MSGTLTPGFPPPPGPDQPAPGGPAGGRGGGVPAPGGPPVGPGGGVPAPGGPPVGPGAQVGQGVEPPAPVSATQPGAVIVNLLPPEYRTRLAVAKAKQRAIIMVSAALGIVLVLLGLTLLQVSSASAALARAQQATVLAQAEVARYAEVPRVAAQLAAIKDGLTNALGSEVLFSEAVASLGTTLPSGVELSSLGYSLTVSATRAATPASPSGAPVPPTYGQVTFTGTAPSLVAVSAFIDQLEASDDYEQVLLTSATRGATTTGATTPDASADAYTFSGTANLSEAALSMRYAKDGVK